MHVGIIMDGNRRYARSRGQIAYAGHAEGYAALKRLLKALRSEPLDIKEISLYAFSVENFQREEAELDRSFQLFRRAAPELEGEELDGIRVRFRGRLELFPTDIRESMLRIEETHREGSLTVNFLVAYNGQDEIVDAARRLLKAGTHPDDIDRSAISKNSYLPDSLPVDLVIRTGMDDGARLSGFMLWHASYAELMFLPETWPEFTHERLAACIEEFKARERRFGR